MFSVNHCLFLPRGELTSRRVERKARASRVTTTRRGGRDDDTELSPPPHVNDDETSSGEVKSSHSHDARVHPVSFPPSCFLQTFGPGAGRFDET